MVPTAWTSPQEDIFHAGYRLSCSCYVLLKHDGPTRELAHAEPEGDGQDGRSRRQKRASEARIGSGSRSAAGILAGASGRPSRRERVGPLRRGAAAAPNSSTYSEGGVPALRQGRRDSEGRCRPPLWSGGALEGCRAATLGQYLHAADRAPRGRRLLAYVRFSRRRDRNWMLPWHRSITRRRSAAATARRSPRNWGGRAR
jgi:hypothetical protein